MKTFGYIVLGIVLMLVSSFISSIIQEKTGFHYIYVFTMLFWLSLWWYAVASIRRSKKKRVTVSKIEDTIRLAALDELEGGKIDRLIWAKALEKADGNEAKAKSLYIKLRVEQEMREKRARDKEADRLNKALANHPPLTK